VIVKKLSEMTGGWFIGDFSPNVLRVKDFEVGVLTRTKAGQKWDKHYHKLATEYNVLISGKMILSGVELNPGDIFVLEPFEIADPEFLEDCVLVCVKTPSCTTDKYIINKEE